MDKHHHKVITMSTKKKMKHKQTMKAWTTYWLLLSVPTAYWLLQEQHQLVVSSTQVSTCHHWQESFWPNICIAGKLHKKCWSNQQRLLCLPGNYNFTIVLHSWITLQQLPMMACYPLLLPPSARWCNSIHPQSSVTYQANIRTRTKEPFQCAVL